MDTPLLHDDEIHLWWAGLALPDSQYERLAQTLSDDEHERAGRYRVDTVRRRFVCGRGILRGLLGGYLDLRPDAVRFSYGAFGKPALNQCHRTDVNFSVAHSEDTAVYAFTKAAAIGVDIEHLQRVVGATIVERFFSATERQIYGGLAESQKPLAFVLGWTRKEAYLKGCGAGLSRCLADLEVTLVPGEPARIRDAADVDRSARWWLGDITVPGELVGAVAVSGGPRRLMTRILFSEPAGVGHVSDAD